MGSACWKFTPVAHMLAFFMVERTQALKSALSSHPISATFRHVTPPSQAFAFFSEKGRRLSVRQDCLRNK